MDIKIVREFKDMGIEIRNLKPLLNLLNTMDERAVKIVYKKIKYSDRRDIFVDLFCKIIPTNKRTLEDIFKIYDTLHRLSFNERALKLANEPNIYVYRSIQEQLLLMDLISKDEFNSIKSLDIFLNEDVLKYRTYKEQVMLIIKVSSYDFDYFCTSLLLNENLLGDRFLEEQMSMIDFVSKHHEFSVWALLSSEKVIVNRSYKDQMRYVNKLIKYGNLSVLDLSNNEGLLEYFSADDHLLLIDKLSLYGFNNILVELLFNEYLLINRNVDEIINLFSYIVSNNYNPLVIKLVGDENILIDRTYEEQVMLIDYFIKLGSNYNAFLVATSYNVNSNRTLEEQIVLMDLISKCFIPDYDLFTGRYSFAAYSFEYQVKCILGEESESEELVTGNLDFIKALKYVRNEKEMNELLQMLPSEGDTKDFSISSAKLTKKMNRKILPF